MYITRIAGFNNYQQQKSYTTQSQHPKNPTFTSDKKMSKMKNWYLSALLAAGLIPTAGVIVRSCSSDTQKDSQGIEYVDKKADLDDRANYVDSIFNPDHKVSQGETLYSISRKYGVSVGEIQAVNKLKDNSIYPDQILKIPPSISIHDIKEISDVSKSTGLSTEYLEELEKIENPQGIKTIFYDGNGNPTIGVGHKLLPNEVEKYKDREITDEEKYTLLTKDLLERETKIIEALNPGVYNDLPKKLRESVFDFAYHRGETAFRNNKKLIDGLNEQNYVQAVANLYKNYSMATNSKGVKYEKHMSGLCKRSLIRMGHANEIFTKGTPDEVLKSAKKTYEEGLRLLKEENNRGEFPNGAYPNILAEYQDIAYNLFDGEIGVKLDGSKNSSAPQSVQQKPAVKPASGSTPVYVNGTKLDRTKQQIEADWANTANRYDRPFKRPELVLDSKGNVTAYVKVIEPVKSGDLSGKIIIVNQGHGGCVANPKSPNNTNFDPGCSNAIMEPIRGANGKFKRDNNGAVILKESNKFIGNGGKALEEWKVNELFANDLIEKLTNSGAKVIFVSGEVHNAQKVIRDLENKHKVNLLISLHSNSSETVKTKTGKNGREYVSERITKRGFFIMPNYRNQKLDVQDNELAKAINKNFHKDSWLVGLGDIKPQSLGILSSSATETSPVPGVLIETGNLKHEMDVANLNSRDFRDRLIQATYNGISEYLNNK